MSNTIKLTGNKITVPLHQPGSEENEFPTIAYVYVIVCLGYWGKGYSVKEAAHNAIAAGAKKTEPCLLRVIASQKLQSETLFAETTVDNCGDILYPRNAVCIPTFNPQDANVKVGQLIK